MNGLEIVLTILVSIAGILSLAKYRYDNGYSKYSPKN